MSAVAAVNTRNDDSSSSISSITAAKERPTQHQTHEKKQQQPMVSGDQWQLMMLTRRQLVVSALVAVTTVLVTTVVVGLDEQVRQWRRLDVLAHCAALQCSNGSVVDPGGGERSALVQRRVWIIGNLKAGGTLQHVMNVFDRLGYEVVSTEQLEAEEASGGARQFDVMWSHVYPFSVYDRWLRELRPGQMINHFPGIGFITSKVDLVMGATPSSSNISGGAEGGAEGALDWSSYIPPAFKLPRDAARLRQYASADASRMFVQKSNTHRNIRVRSVDQLDLSDNGTFVQQFIANPLLVDGYKFDIGVYVVLTSLNPLRVYMYDDDVLLRFCAERYHPFSEQRLAGYVVGDKYTPTWRVPSLADYYSRFHLGHRGSLNAHLVAQGLRPQTIWRQIDAAIRAVYRGKEAALLSGVQTRYGRGTTAANVKGHFFELVRFDFLVDDLLRVHMIEANMSPNLSSSVHSRNRLLYEQVLYSLLSVVGVASRLRGNIQRLRTGPVAEMQLSLHQLAVSDTSCISSSCPVPNNDSSSVCPEHCRVCVPCMSQENRRVLFRAAAEHFNRHHFRRLLPHIVTAERPGPTSDIASSSATSTTVQDHREAERTELSMLQSMSALNRLQYRWFRAKCLQDSSWC